MPTSKVSANLFKPKSSKIRYSYLVGDAKTYLCSSTPIDIEQDKKQEFKFPIYPIAQLVEQNSLLFQKVLSPSKNNTSSLPLFLTKEAALTAAINLYPEHSISILKFKFLAGFSQPSSENLVSITGYSKIKPKPKPKNCFAILFVKSKSVDEYKNYAVDFTWSPPIQNYLVHKFDFNNI